MNLILLRFLFIKGRSYLYNSLIITKQLVQWFILSYTRSKSFHLPLTDNFQYHLSVLCNFEQIFHSGYHNHSIPWNSWSIQSHPCSLCSMMSIQSCAVLLRQWFWAGPQSQDPTRGQVHTVSSHSQPYHPLCSQVTAAPLVGSLFPLWLMTSENHVPPLTTSVVNWENIFWLVLLLPKKGRMGLGYENFSFLLPPGMCFFLSYGTTDGRVLPNCSAFLLSLTWHLLFLPG